MKNGHLRTFPAGEWAWVSGASSGIGREVALQFSRAGVGVVLSARREQELDCLAEEILAEGGNAFPLTLDVEDAKAIAEAAGTIEAKTGRLDIVVPCAGKELVLPLRLLTPEKMQGLWNVHVRGSFEMVRASLKMLKASGEREGAQGRVVLISSVAAVRGWPGQCGYSQCKAALLGGMRSLAVELAPLRIRVNAVVPGMVRTGLQERLFSKLPEEKRNEIAAAHPLGMGEPSDVAQAVLFLASPAAKWITGASLAVDGGLSVS